MKLIPQQLIRPKLDHPLIKAATFIFYVILGILLIFLKLD